MLYVTTRSDADAYTAHRVMTTDRAPGGGQFIPRHMPCFSGEDLHEMTQRSFHENLARVLDLLCGAELTGRDVEYAIGSHVAHTLDLDSRTMVCELWHGGDGTFANTVDRLLRLLVTEPKAKAGQWFTMSVRIAMLFAVYADLMAKGVEMPLDLAVPSMDFQMPMAAWYARSWGLPIGRIIVACNENNAPWSLLHLGEMRADIPVRHTITEACDQSVPAGLERLIQAVLGGDELKKYLSVLEQGGLYKPEQSQQEALRRGLSVSVISQRRTAFMIPNLYRMGRWNPDPYAAMAYAALADHRARAGETGKALVLAEENPLCSAELLAGMLTMPVERMRRKLERI